MAEHIVLYNRDILRLIFRCLPHPKDLKAAQSVCKLWHKIYPRKDIVFNLKIDDPKLWAELLIIRTKVELGNRGCGYQIKFIDDHSADLVDDAAEYSSFIILVQSYSKDDRLYKVRDSSWITSYFGLAQCKNRLRYDETDGMLHISISSKGLNLGETNMRELIARGMNYQKWRNGGYERNIILSADEILDWIPNKI